MNQLALFSEHQSCRRCYCDAHAKNQPRYYPPEHSYWTLCPGDCDGECKHTPIWTSQGGTACYHCGRTFKEGGAR